MHKSLTLAVRAAMVVGALGLVAGCSNVTPEQLSAVEAKANSASMTASEAMKTASAAAEAAKAAQASADAAMACCNDNKSRLDSLFEKAMRK